MHAPKKDPQQGMVSLESSPKFGSNVKCLVKAGKRKAIKVTDSYLSETQKVYYCNRRKKMKSISDCEGDDS